MSANRSVVEQLRPEFFADFHQIVHVARKCGRFHVWCFWGKVEELSDFSSVQIPILVVSDSGHRVFQRIGLSAQNFA